MSVSNGLKLFANLFATGLYTFKVIADYKKHGTHEAHNQLCDCMGYCTRCIWTEAYAKSKAKAKA
jgi:hypothetical protein